MPGLQVKGGRTTGPSRRGDTTAKSLKGTGPLASGTMGGAKGRKNSDSMSKFDEFDSETSSDPEPAPVRKPKVELPIVVSLPKLAKGKFVPMPRFRKSTSKALHVEEVSQYHKSMRALKEQLQPKRRKAPVSEISNHPAVKGKWQWQHWEESVGDVLESSSCDEDSDDDDHQSKKSKVSISTAATGARKPKKKIYYGVGMESTSRATSRGSVGPGFKRAGSSAELHRQGSKAVVTEGVNGGENSVSTPGILSPIAGGAGSIKAPDSSKVGIGQGHGDPVGDPWDDVTVVLSEDRWEDDPIDDDIARMTYEELLKPVEGPPPDERKSSQVFLLDLFAGKYTAPAPRVRRSPPRVKQHRRRDADHQGEYQRGNGSRGTTPVDDECRDGPGVRNGAHTSMGLVTPDNDGAEGTPSRNSGKLDHGAGGSQTERVTRESCVLSVLHESPDGMAEAIAAVSKASHQVSKRRIQGKMVGARVQKALASLLFQDKSHALMACGDDHVPDAVVKGLKKLANKAQSSEEEAVRYKRDASPTGGVKSSTSTKSKIKSKTGQGRGGTNARRDGSMASTADSTSVGPWPGQSSETGVMDRPPGRHGGSRHSNSRDSAGGSDQNADNGKDTSAKASTGMEVSSASEFNGVENDESSTPIAANIRLFRTYVKPVTINASPTRKPHESRKHRSRGHSANEAGPQTVAAAGKPVDDISHPTLDSLSQLTVWDLAQVTALIRVQAGRLRTRQQAFDRVVSVRQQQEQKIRQRQIDVEARLAQVAKDNAERQRQFSETENRKLNEVRLRQAAAEASINDQNEEATKNKLERAERRREERDRKRAAEIRTRNAVMTANQERAHEVKERQIEEIEQLRDTVDLIKDPKTVLPQRSQSSPRASPSPSPSNAATKKDTRHSVSPQTQTEQTTADTAYPSVPTSKGASSVTEPTADTPEAEALSDSAATPATGSEPALANEPSSKPSSKPSTFAPPRRQRSQQPQSSAVGTSLNSASPSVADTAVASVASHSHADEPKNIDETVTATAPSPSRDVVSDGDEYDDDFESVPGSQATSPQQKNA